jgi:hypothetical protein
LPPLLARLLPPSLESGQMRWWWTCKNDSILHWAIYLSTRAHVGKTWLQRQIRGPTGPQTQGPHPMA